MNLNPIYLDNPRTVLTSTGDLNACLNAKGLYNSFHFVLRLSPLVHNKIESLPQGIVSGIDEEGLQAYSTYLHETIHWWQHIGSTTGLMLSLSYPGQTHSNYKLLMEYVKIVGPKKSIIEIAESLTRVGKKNRAYRLSNTIVNNHFDIEFFRILSTNPKTVNEVLESPYFECIGHSYLTAYSNILGILSDTFDQADGVIQDPSTWEKPFKTLRRKKIKNFYYGSDIMVSPVGAHALFEGQARFSQIQFLYFSSGKKLTWDDFKSKGMLTGIYVEAFEGFLKLCELSWPASPDDPIIGLFLLICDISINPGVGFPFPLIVFKAFVDDLDPGMRFLMLCLEVRKNPAVASKIHNYSREEYIEVCNELTKPLYLHSPLEVAQEFVSMIAKSKKIQGLMREHQTYEYSNVNLPIRVLFSHFLSFCEDKIVKPEFFCWPGAWSAGDRATDDNLATFNKHSALFRDKEHDDGIFPHIPPGKIEKNVQSMFNGFYSTNVAYDMTRQWITTKGPFNYNYRWLSTNKAFDSKVYAVGAFESAYHFHPDTMILV